MDDKKTKSRPVEVDNTVYNAVRCVGTLKPVFDPKANGFFPPNLSVAGTGFWIAQYGCFITCAHVIEGYIGKTIDESGMMVVGGNGHTFQRARYSVVDYRHDLALLDVKFSNKEEREVEIREGLSFADVDPAVGEPIAYAGFPFGTELLNAKHSPTYSEGVVGKEILHTDMCTEVQFTGPVVGGYSGSPVVLKSDRGKIVGVLSNGPSDNGNTGDIFKGIHWQHVKALCELATMR